MDRVNVIGNFTLLVIIIQLAFPFFNFGQSLSGVSGLINIPSAVLLDDSEIVAGFVFTPSEVVEYTKYKKDIFSSHIQLAFTPFIEIGIRLVRQLQFSNGAHNVDRILNLKIRILNEKHFFPSIVVGINSFPSKLSDATHFQSLYIVSTKNFHEFLGLNNIGFTFGYGSDLIKAADHQFIGLFGGISLDYSLFTIDHSLLFEYDAERFNAGIRLTFFDHIKLLVGAMDMKYLSGGLSYGFQL